MKKLILTLALVLATLPAFAAEVINIQVKGMVCDFCAQSVWKVFKDYDGVKDMKVDLDTQIVTIYMEDGKTLSEEDLEKGITYSGYDYVSHERVQSDE